MSEMNFPEKLTVEWLRLGYSSGTMSPADVMAEVVRRAEADAGMNIWITPPSLELAQPYLDRLMLLDKNNSPLWGIPFAIKDNIDMAGVPTTAGCPEFAYTPKEHATVVERLVAAGAIPIGKTNLDQFATGLVGTRSPYGETHNALRPELISGGSSSGSAVAVARGHAVFSLGTDTAGSGRVPAALNGLVGYKPSLGAWPVKGVVPACASLDCVTVFAHHLEESLLVDTVARGIDEHDPWSREITRLKAERPVKLCLPKEAAAFYGPFAAEYEAAWLATVKRLEQLGIPIAYVDGELFTAAAELLYGGPFVAERWADLSGFIEANPGVAFPVTEQVLRSGAAEEYDAASVFTALHKLQSYKLEARKLLQDAVLVMPTCGGTWTREQLSLNKVGANSDMGRYTNHCNLLDLCAVALPSGDAGEKLPFGITLFALAENEHVIEGAAHSIQSGSAELALSAANENKPVQKAETAEAARSESMIVVAVCGLHMRGYPLEKQMEGLHARFVREASSAPRYKLVKLPTTPAKPGMIKQQEGGASIELELWEMSAAAFGEFVSFIPSPLGIGKVELLDGTEVSGFVCEAYAAVDAEDITAYGGWRHVPLG
ncbi:allophanate hydrolase [Paenibacillus endophyticus]|uniref:Allophanate hydrolase n=1 Tax=Paenibacillus endophyticus TaxID=1294268 RepID=A0A7W5C3Z0_9BACL|nr:allophanate hydrolase [Paenibacillus endophyticus]MBB3150798.1 allophanate hydrolase [Paenibacillus endophyticus]